MARVQISLDDDVLKQIDEYAKQVSLTRSAFLSMTAVEYIKAKRQTPIITNIFMQFASVINQRAKGEIDDAEYQKLLENLDGNMAKQLE